MALDQSDLYKIEQIVEQKLDEKFDEKFKILPSKDEFYTKMDQVMGELKGIREAQEINSHRTSKLEDIHPNYSHSFTKTTD